MYRYRYMDSPVVLILDSVQDYLYIKFMTGCRHGEVKVVHKTSIRSTICNSLNS